MKTNRFEEILRRKLESLQPEFQEKDWDKWQSFRQQHASPTFWQSYGNWLGYAAATVATAAMVILYVHQSNQNEALLKELKEMKQQMAASTSAATQSENPAATSAPVADTVYIVKGTAVYAEPLAKNSSPNELAETPVKPAPGQVPGQSGTLAENSTGRIGQDPVQNTPEEQSTVPSFAANPASVPPSAGPGNESGVTTPHEDSPVPGARNTGPAENTNRPNTTSQNRFRQSERIAAQPNSGSDRENIPASAIGAEQRVDLGDVTFLPAPSLSQASPKYNSPQSRAQRRLLSRMPQPAQQVKNPTLAQRDDRADPSTKAATRPAETKVEKSAQPQRLVPDIHLKVPVRVGLSQLWEDRTKALGLWSEVVLGKHWALQAGLVKQKLETQKFFSEKMFREKMNEEFRKKHAQRLPPNFDIFNITSTTSLIRIPLNVVYRGDLGHGFSYLAGAGTNLNMEVKQVLSFDFKRPTSDFGKQSAERNLPHPVLNNATFLLGIEKQWSPIVVQVNPFLETRFKTFPYLRDRTSAGVRVNLLYEFGGKRR